MLDINDLTFALRSVNVGWDKELAISSQYFRTEENDVFMHNSYYTFTSQNTKNWHNLSTFSLVLQEILYTVHTVL